jgi:hypothetical protein
MSISTNKSTWEPSTPFKISVIFSLLVLSTISWIRYAKPDLIPSQYVPWIPVWMVALVVILLLFHADRAAIQPYWLTGAFVLVAVLSTAYILILKFWEKDQEVQDCPVTLPVSTAKPSQETDHIRLGTAIGFSVFLLAALVASFPKTADAKATSSSSNSSSRLPWLSFGKASHTIPESLNPGMF